MKLNKKILQSSPQKPPPNQQMMSPAPSSQPKDTNRLKLFCSIILYKFCLSPQVSQNSVSPHQSPQVTQTQPPTPQPSAPQQQQTTPQPQQSVPTAQATPPVQSVPQQQQQQTAAPPMQKATTPPTSQVFSNKKIIH